MIMTQGHKARETESIEVEETQFWSMYPQNVHLATTGSSGSGFSLQSRKMFALFAFAGLSVGIAILGYYIGAKYNVGLLGLLVGLFVGIIISMFLYTKLIRDKFNEDFESDTKNKILKLFRIRLNHIDAEEKVADSATLMSYTNGDNFVTLRIEIGNSNDSTEAITAELLDRIMKSAHQLNLQVKNYNTRSEWRSSDVHHNHLKRLTTIQDDKLKETLARIDAHQSKIFDNSKVLSLNIVLVSKRSNQHGLKAIVEMIDDWKKDYIFMSSIRRMKWLDKDETIQSLCDFLTVQMLDVTSNLNKETVKFESRSIVSVYSKSQFRPSEDVKIESKATPIRKRKVNK